MRSSLRASTILTALLSICAASFPQTDPKNVPQPPTAELKKFDPFLGKFNVSGDFANLPWTGTLELRRAIKGWYIEQIILVKTEGIDREFRILATWDKNVRKYRLWGFQTLPIMPDNGGEIRFEGEEMITEWVSVRPDGSQVTSSNRYRFVSKDELEIVSFRQAGTAPTEKIGFLKGKRMLNAGEAAVSTLDHPAANSAQTGPEMQSLAKAFEGTWSISEKSEPSESRPNGAMGHATEVWRPGPGGFTFMEEFRDDDPAGEFGLALIWWDKTKGFQGAWCTKTNPKGCVVNNPSGSFKWDGKQQLVDNEFKRNGKIFRWHEVFADITPTSFVQTADTGEKGGPLKREITIHAMRTAEGTQVPEAVSTRDIEAASSEMRRLFQVFRGRWKVRMQRSSGTVGDGEEIWRPGPGGVTLIEDESMKDANDETCGLSVTWWDAIAKGYRAMWCDNKLPSGCMETSNLAKWEGDDFVLRYEAERDGKKFDYKKVVSDITPTSYKQTIYQAEAGQWKPVVSFQATKVADSPGSKTSAAPSIHNPDIVSDRHEMKTLASILAGSWHGTVTTEPTQQANNSEGGRSDEVWRFSPGKLTLIEENHVKTTRGESDDYAVVWWNRKAQKYQGIWCAEINDEGCSGFDAKLELNQVMMAGEWEQSGHRRAWHEVFSRPTPNSSVQTLYVGEPGAELKRASTITATEVSEAPMPETRSSGAEAELRAVMAEMHKAALAGDTEKTASLMTDEYVQTDISGHFQNKTEWLDTYSKPLAQLIKEGKFHWEVYDERDVQIRIYNDAAVVTGTFELKGAGARWGEQHAWVADPNARPSATLRFTRIFIQRNGKWLLAALHNAVPPPPANK